MSFKRKFISGVGWLGILRVTTRAIDFAKLAFLARILEQSAFGSFAIVTTTINLLETLTQTGLQIAVIHYQLKIHHIFKTLLVINIIRGILLSLLTCLSAFALTNFYQSPELLQLLIISSVIPLIKGFQNPAIIVFYQKLQFKREFLFRVIPAAFGSVVAIFFVFITPSAIGLVYGLIATSILETLFSYVVIKHYFNTSFSFSHVKKIFGFTKWLTMSSVFSYLINQIDNLFVGKIFNLATLGLYDLVFKLASIIFTEVTDIISRVLFPSLVSIKGNTDRLKRTYLKTTLFLLLPASISTLLFLLFPKEILIFAFGEQWAKASSVLQILSIYGFIRAINGPIGPLFLAIGKPHILSITDIVNFIILILLLYPFTMLWQLNGVALAIVVAYSMVQPILLYHLIKYYRS